MGFGKDGTGVIIRDNDQITLGALNANAAIKQANPLVLAEDFRVLKSEHYLTMESATFVAGDGPIIVGIANNELSAAEIAGCLNTDGPLNRNDRGNTETAMRAVFPFIQMPFVENAVGLAPGIPNDGAPVKDTHRWTYSNPEGFTLFAFNHGGSALTTGGILRNLSTYYGVWV